MANGTASADPARLEAAALAVPEELRTELVDGHQRLGDLLATFSGSTQSPDRIFLNPEYITGWMGRAYERGEELDQRLIRVAAAFRAAGDGRPPGFVGPLAPSAVLFMDEAALAGELDRWNDPQPLEFRQRDDGGYDVRGRDGHWYRVQTGPPIGGVPLDSRQEVADLGNPDYGLVMGAAITIGLTGGSSQPMVRSAPPSAYDHIHLDANGNPVAGPGVTGQSLAPRPRPPGDAGAEAADGIGLVEGALHEASQYVDERHRNVYRTQTTYYVDPHSGDRVAVVDAASIRYDNDSNDAIVTSGRLSTDDRGRPELVPPPSDPNAPICVPSGPSFEASNTLRIPLEDS